MVRDAMRVVVGPSSRYGGSEDAADDDDDDAAGGGSSDAAMRVRSEWRICVRRAGWDVGGRWASSDR